MRVAVVNQPLDGVLPPDQNSIGIWTYETSRRIADRCDITVFAKRTGSVRELGIGRRYSADAVDFRFLFAGPNRIWQRIATASSSRLRRDRPIYVARLYFFEYVVQVAWMIRRMRPDVVHIHNFVGFVPTIRAFNRRTSIVLHMSCEWLSLLDAELMRKRLRHVDMILGTSDHITDLVKQRFPEYADRYHTVYNGVDPATFSEAAAARVAEPLDGDPKVGQNAGPSILFVGRVSPEKGVHDLIDAMAIVFDAHPNARLDIVGSIGALDPDYIVRVSDDPEVLALDRFYTADDQHADYAAALRARVPAGREHQVVFHGAVSYDAVIDHYRRTDVLVNPSYSESFGMTPVEAMACQVPVIATHIGGMKETLVDGVTGLSVERGDIEGLADAIDRIVSDPQLGVSMGKAGRERVINKFSWESVGNTIVERYQSLLNEHHRGDVSDAQ